MVDIATASIKIGWIAAGAIVIFLLSKIAKKATRRTLERIDEGLENIEFEENFYVLTNKILSILSLMIFVIYVAYIFGITDIFFAFITGASVFGLAIGIATKDIINNIIFRHHHLLHKHGQIWGPHSRRWQIQGGGEGY